VLKGCNGNADHLDYRDTKPKWVTIVVRAYSPFPIGVNAEPLDGGDGKERRSMEVTEQCTNLVI
jgi:hypothetical protein